MKREVSLKTPIKYRRHQQIYKLWKVEGSRRIRYISKCIWLTKIKDKNINNLKDPQQTFSLKQ